MTFSEALFKLPNRIRHSARHDYYKKVLVLHTTNIDGGLAPIDLYADQHGNRLCEVRILFDSASVEYTWENADGVLRSYPCPITSLYRLMEPPDPPPISESAWKALERGALNLCQFLDRQLEGSIAKGEVEVAGRLYDELAPITFIPPDVWSQCTPLFDAHDCARMPSNKLVYMLHLRLSRPNESPTVYDRLFDEKYLVKLPKKRRGLFRVFMQMPHDAKANLSWAMFEHRVAVHWREGGNSDPVPTLSTIRSNWKLFEARQLEDRQKTAEKASDPAR